MTFYAQPGHTVSLALTPSLPAGLLLVVVTPITFLLRSGNRDTLVTYSPQRLIRQFGFGQGAVLVYVGTCIDVWDVESYYVGGVQDSLLGNHSSIYWPCTSQEGIRSLGGALYWMKCVDAFTKFMAPNSQDPLVFAVPVLVSARDLYL